MWVLQAELDSATVLLFHPPTKSCLAVPLWLYRQGPALTGSPALHTAREGGSPPPAQSCVGSSCALKEGAQKGRELEAEGKGRQSHPHP